MLTLNAQASAAQQLKDRTKENHEAVEAMLVPEISSKKATDEYITLRKPFYGFYQPLEKQIKQFIDSMVTSEAVQKFSWGGNSNQALRFASDGKKYQPRASSGKWQVTGKGTAVTWKKEELEIAEN